MTNKKTFPLRLPDDLKKRAQAAAVVENRTLTSLMVDAIAYRVAAVEQREAVRDLAEARRSAV